MLLARRSLSDAARSLAAIASRPILGSLHYNSILNHVWHSALCTCFWRPDARGILHSESSRRRCLQCRTARRE